MGRSNTSSKRKSTKRKREKRKKRQRKGLKRHCRDYDSVSSYSNEDSPNTEDTSSFASKSRRGRIQNKNKKKRRDPPLSSSSDDQSMSSDSDSLSTYEWRRKNSKARRSRVALRSTKKKDRKRFAETSSDSDAGNVRKRKRVGRDVKPRKKSSKKRSRKRLSSSSDSESYSACSSSDSEHQRNNVIIDEEKERVRSRESNKARMKDKVSSPSSSYGWGIDHSVGVNDGDGAVTCVDNPRRLKSVIAVVVDRSHDEGEDIWEKDPQKEEIVYDREDYPSPKSLDSYEGVTKMELDNYCSASSKRVRVENVVGKDATGPGKSGICEDSEPQSEGANKKNFDDLESILRQKALENLKKFRGKVPIGPESSNLPAGKVDSVQSKSTKPDSSIDRVTEPSLKKDFSQVNEVEKFPDGELTENAYGTAEQTADGTVLLGCQKEDKGTDSCTVLSKNESRGDSSVGAVTGDNGIDQQNKDKDGSQFEQRTMSVMRGGEMVQVSYKVYIPKKTPALARRQLRR